MNITSSYGIMVRQAHFYICYDCTTTVLRHASSHSPATMHQRGLYSQKKSVTRSKKIKTRIYIKARAKYVKCSPLVSRRVSIYGTPSPSASFYTFSFLSPPVIHFHPQGILVTIKPGLPNASFFSLLSLA